MLLEKPLLLKPVTECVLYFCILIQEFSTDAMIRRFSPIATQNVASVKPRLASVESFVPLLSADERV